MYQLLLRFRVQRDCAWERMYHRKVRGRFGQALKRAGIDRYQDTPASPFTFSDWMPAADDQHPGADLTAGDELRLLVAAHDRDVLGAIANDLQTHPEATAGAFVLDARAATPIETTVGPPGTRGTLTTASGVIATVESSIHHDVEHDVHWSDDDHTTAEFAAALQQSAATILTHRVGVDDVPDPLFDSHDHRKTYAVPVDVTPEHTETQIVSKWELGYRVRDDHHRRCLDALLGTGVGRKRSYGFGTLQTRRSVRESSAADRGEVSA